MYNENVLGKQRLLRLLRDCRRVGVTLAGAAMLTQYDVFKRTAGINCYNRDNDVVYYLKLRDLLLC